MSSPPATSTPARNGRDPTDDERDHTPMMANELASTNGNANGDSGHNQHADDNPPAPSSEHSANDSHMNQRGEKQIKPNKVYIGGLPEQTRQEDLQACFGKIGTIVSIELKLGYGFVEFDSREAAEESVAKYHEGYFMGNKIRVELSHGGGRTAKYVGEPGACFKCGTHGHWARECPNNAMPGYRGRDEGRYSDRKEHGHHPAPYPPREYPPYREDYARYSAAASRDRYLDYYAPPPPAREYRGPPARETRDAYPPQPRGGRDDEYRRMAPAPYREERPAYYAHYESMPPPPRDSAYPPRPYSGAVERGRPPYPGYSAPPAPTRREDYDRSSRDYPPPPAEYRSSHPSYSIDTAGVVRPLLHTGMHLLTNVMPLVTVATPQATLLGHRSPATPAVLDPLAHDAKPLGTEAPAAKTQPLLSPGKMTRLVSLA